jgi:hypothetical protein
MHKGVKLIHEPVPNPNRAQNAYRAARLLAASIQSKVGMPIFVFYPMIPFFGIEDAFYDKIQNAVYSYSESWHTRDPAGDG